MTQDKIFCMVPWFEVHINANGSYHTCGAQPNPMRMPYPPGWVEKHNVHNMRLEDWINSEYQNRVRLDKLNGVYEARCNMCYNEEVSGSSSKRLKENHKSKIDATAFELTYQRSPDLKHFEFSRANQGQTDVLRPVSYHMSLGNECNYACRMCGPWHSTQLAVEGIKNGTYSGPARLNWTEDEAAWKHVTDYICETETLQFVHLIGGEPYMNPRFEELIDKLLAAGRTDIYLGFTTNGSTVDTALVEKLNAFRHVDIGISIECTGVLNDYVRRGTKTNEVLDNIDLYLKYKREAHVYVTVRPVPSALSVHTLHKLYGWAASRGVDVMTNVLSRPEHLQIRQLPRDVKDRLLAEYRQWEFSEPAPADSNPRDPTWFKQHIDSEIRVAMYWLEQEADPEQTAKLYDTIRAWGWFDNPDIAKYFETEYL
jgi:sulfatase maturation enzyme AslB (radical SAM superfamily)